MTSDAEERTGESGCSVLAGDAATAPDADEASFPRGLLPPLLVHGLLLAGILLLFETTELDLVIQDLFYLGDGAWLLGGRHRLMERLCHQWPRVLLVMLGALCLAGFLLSYRLDQLRPWRQACLRMTLALAIVPLTIASLKAVSNVYEPNALRRYGGRQPYVRPLERYPPGFVQKTRPHGWPAGHASGGFALAMLGFSLRGRRSRRFGLALGIALGWMMGSYQMLRGNHFLSHTLATQSIAWIEILLIARGTRGAGLRSPLLHHRIRREGIPTKQDKEP